MKLFINGRFLNGTPTLAVFSGVIDKELERAAERR